MSEFKGTKGKWKLANNEYGYYTSVRDLDDTRKVCVSRVNNLIESNANMALIAHAPEMLEVLKEFLAINGGCMQDVVKHKIKVAKLIKQATEG